MIALAVACLMVGAAAGVILMGMVAAGRREDDCRACRGDKAFRVDDECDRVEGHSSAPRDAVADARGACPQPDGSR